MANTQNSSPTIVVNLRRSYGYNGVSYGPGARVTVPVALASALNLKAVDDLEAQASEPKTNAEGRALPPVAALAQHLSTLTTRDQVEALMALDKRSTAQKLYDARLVQLESPGDSPDAPSDAPPAAPAE